MNKTLWIIKYLYKIIIYKKRKENFFASDKLFLEKKCRAKNDTLNDGNPAQTNNQ